MEFKNNFHTRDRTLERKHTDNIAWGRSLMCTKHWKNARGF